MATAIIVGTGIGNTVRALHPADGIWNTHKREMTIAAAALIGRSAIRAFRSNFASANTTFLRGGFENKMSRREAAQILGIKESANKIKIKEAHRRIMLLNHPDRGGSPYVASKVNEAKDLLEKNK
jgi:hypothetical protein